MDPVVHLQEEGYRHLAVEERRLLSDLSTKLHRTFTPPGHNWVNPHTNYHSLPSVGRAVRKYDTLFETLASSTTVLNL